MTPTGPLPAAPHVGPPILSCVDVSFAYPDPERQHAGKANPLVIRNLSIEFAAGEATALLGPNGSGKTTFLHLLLGILTPLAGEVRVGARARGSFTRRELSQTVGLVAQDEGLVFDLPIEEYVLLGRAPYLGLLELPGESDRAVARRAVDATGLSALRERPVTALSGGERQLATIARALAQEPAVLLLDEPTSHLDLANARRVTSLLGDLRDRGKTIVFSTHDPNEAAAVADRVLLIRRGGVVAVGPTAEVLTSEHLSATYGVPVEVAEIHGRPFALVR